MSGAGISPLAVLAPDLYVKQLAIQRRQALAQSLLESGESDPGHGAYGGVRNAGNAILGAFLAKRGDQDMANLYSPQPSDTDASGMPPVQSQSSVQPLSQSSQPEPQISNNPGSGPTPQALGAALQGNSPAPEQNTQSQVGPAQSPQNVGAPRSIPQAINGAIPDLPGMSHQQSILAYFQSPSAYFTALAAANAPTPEEKNANFATNGQGPANQLVMGGLMKSASDNLRPGGGSINYATGNVITMPNTNGVQTTFPQGINGPAQMGMVQGAPQALAGSSMATAAGTQAVKPNVAFDAQGMPVATNNLAMTGNTQAQGLVGQGMPQQPMGLRNNNPGNLMPGGQEATYKTPAEGILRASSNLDNYAAKGINTLNGIASNWAPANAGNNPQAYAGFLAQRLGVNPNQPIDLKNPAIKGAVLDGIFAYENGPGKMQAAGAPSPQPGGLMPALPASQAPYMAGQGKDASDRHDQTITEAQGSPDRVNVLNNILQLSQSGVTSGPGAEFQQKILGYAANTPGLSQIMGKTQGNVAKFQELQKFLLQNGQRAWQAAGGTGTDAQLESASHANPNDAQFPQALQTITKWVKAGELAVQGKANAQDQYLQQNGNTAQNQIAFENQWRNNLDRRVYQLQTMAPQEQQQFVKSLSPADAKSLLQKRQNLRALGGLP